MSLERTLYLGLEKPCDVPEELHYPVIRIEPSPVDDPGIHATIAGLPKTSHLLLTSKTAVRLFYEALCAYSCSVENLAHIRILAIGKATASRIQHYGLPGPHAIAQQETAEGVLSLLEQEKQAPTFVLWPHSALSRPLIEDYLEEKEIAHHCPAFYTSLPHNPGSLPASGSYNEILFTSPSTVEAFMALHGSLPNNKQLRAIGPITAEALKMALFQK